MNYNLRLAAQNCQSLNVSTKNSRTTKKILALVNNSEDVIFLSDLKLNTSRNKHASHDIEKQFFSKNYKFFHNSTASSRGVGILINRKVFEQLLEEVADPNNNFLLLKVKLNTGIWVLGAVYGPNDNDRGFFADLSAGIRRLSCDNTVIAGDWNSTWDPRPVNQNLDVINMVSIPSRQGSLWLGQLAADTDMTDPYRVLYPIKKEFTYVPNARINLNRSRLDFF
jgi:hypothetical protein